ncbi:blue copper protein-like [Vitis riparia]|uniref:blue copper protein-like n=1 Tax=Vitis riparia TaxID=96939 RepID=UPI00155B184C|nr:blue copper protein-like [Vitis riparia]
MTTKIRAALVVVALAALLHTAVVVAQTTHVVGDSLGWLVPPGGPIAYATWADTQTFVVGDILVFNFTTGEQDVARVSKESFDSCNSTNPISLKTTGPANFTLDTVGDYYFIGTMDRHCPLGQKLAIKVIDSSSGPSPPPSPRSPVTYTVGDILGWVVPPLGEVAYSTWAYNKIFIVGDSLVFNFINGTQDVAVVTKEAYDSCNTSSTIAVYATSPTTITLTTTGMHYFTSTYELHCGLGQKLAINVIAKSTTPSPSGAATPPSSSVGASPSAGGPTAPPPSSSAPSQIVAGAIALLSIAVAFLH